jgi:TRAP-type mannitol/chloroaromatic compound transport system permease small subunit
MTVVTQLRLILDRISRVLTLVGAYAILAATALVIVEIVQRKTGFSTVEGADELSGYALAIATTWAFSYAFFRGSHIRIDALYRFLPLAWRAWLDVVAVLALLGVALLLTYWGALEFANSFRYGGVSNTMLRTPIWIPQLFWLSGFVLFAMSTGVALIEALLKLVAGELQAAHNLIGDPSTTEREGNVL